MVHENRKFKRFALVLLMYLCAYKDFFGLPLRNAGRWCIYIEVLLGFLTCNFSKERWSLVYMYIEVLLGFLMCSFSKERWLLVYVYRGSLKVLDV